MRNTFTCGKMPHLDRTMADLPQTPDGVDAPKPVSLEDLVTNHIEQVLAAHAGNISAAARALGLDRRTLQRRLRRLGRAAEPANAPPQ
jgi:two-component system response regulator RegA